LLPEEILTYFDLVDIREQDGKLVFCLERNNNYRSIFHPETKKPRVSQRARAINAHQQTILAYFKNRSTNALAENALKA